MIFNESNIPCDDIDDTFDLMLVAAIRAFNHSLAHIIPR